MGFTGFYRVLPGFTGLRGSPIRLGVVLAEDEPFDVAAVEVGVQLLHQRPVAFDDALDEIAAPNQTKKKTSAVHIIPFERPFQNSIKGNHVG